MAWIANNSPNESQRAVSRRDPGPPFSFEQFSPTFSFAITEARTACQDVSWYAQHDWAGTSYYSSQAKPARSTDSRSVTQCLSILAAFLFPKSERPRLVKGASTNIAFQTLGVVLATSMTCYYRYQNRKRDREEGGAPPKGMHIDGIATEFDKAKGERYSDLLDEREELRC